MSARKLRDGQADTQLRAGALITPGRQLADAMKDLVTVAPIEALS